MSYESPIDIIIGEAQTKLQGDVLKVIQNYHIKVDRDELIKALAYDRGQYDKGWSDGYVQAKRDIVRCKDCKLFYPEHEGGIGSCGLDMNVTANDYCSRGERKDEVEE